MAKLCTIKGRFNFSCAGAYKIENLREGIISEPYGDNKDLIDVTLTFDERMISSFTNKRKNSDIESYERKVVITTIILDAFKSKVREYMNSPFGKLTNACMGNVDYKVRLNDTFLIEPTDDYNELMYKRSRYDYQHEGRIVLKKIRFNDIQHRLDLITGEYDSDMVRIDEDIFSLRFKCHIAKNEECP